MFVDLAVAISVDPVAPDVGQPVTITLDVTNNGPDDGTGVVVVFPIPPGIDVTSVVPSQGACTVTASEVTCDLGTVPVGTMPNIEIIGTRLDPGPVTVTATVDGDQLDPSPDNNTDAQDMDAGEEICGNCLDDDGDDLVDYDDPDCCAVPATLEIRRARIFSRRSNSRTARGRIRASVDETFGSIDPRDEDVLLQLFDANGPLACCLITSDHWMRLGRRKFGYWDRKTELCPPIADLSIRNRRDGSLRVVVRAKGGGLDRYADPNLSITVGAGSRCATGGALLRPKGSRGWVLP